MINNEDGIGLLLDIERGCKEFTKVVMEFMKNVWIGITCFIHSFHFFCDVFGIYMKLQDIFGQIVKHMFHTYVNTSDGTINCNRYRQNRYSFSVIIVNFLPIVLSITLHILAYKYLSCTIFY